jgi:putative ABC transport system permease protein
MGPLRYLPLVVKQVTRRTTRTLLTVLGVAAAMFLFVSIRSLERGVAAATEETGRDAKLIVYRENRFCPAASQLPQRYEPSIASVKGVTEVIPMKIVVTNCRASLDVVTFRGVPAADFATKEARAFRMTAGTLDAWLARQDAALVGKTLADRRGFKPGDRFQAAGITVTVAGIFDSPEPQHMNVAYVHLPFLQQQPGIDRLGVVTQFSVKVDDPTQLDRIGREIDALFASDEAPTSTRSEKAFTARAAEDVMELLGFASWVAIACVGAVLALVANAIVLSVQDRVKDFAVMETLGYPGRLLAGLVVAEGAVLSAIGGVVGAAAAVGVLAWKSPSLSSEGLSIEFAMDASVWGPALATALVTGVLAGLVPAFRVARQSIANSFRAV